MPKLHGTRKQKAAELLAAVKRGPAFSDIGRETFTPEEATRQYQLWARSWIVPELRLLVPELRRAFPEVTP